MILKHKIFYLLLCSVCVLGSFAQNNYLFDSTSIQIKPLNINTDESEFAPFKIGKLLYYSSSQERKIGAISMDDATLHQMLDLYVGVFSDSVKVRNVKPLNDKINNPLNQGSCFFDKDSSRLYYSSDTYANFNRTNKNYKLAIYSAKYENGEFATPRTELVLPDTFSASHPVIFNNKLYFSANLEGGWGKTDIYTAEKVDGQWKFIKNLAQVNSAENEFFPYPISDNEIYFSSSRPGGFGKLDLYKCTTEGDKSVIQNLGYFINSTDDDFAIYIDSLEESGYFSTNRVRMQDDIYYFSKTWPNFTNCADPVVEDYCYNLSEESTMSADSMKNYYYEWTLGDGSKERGLEIRHCFPGPGKYLISLNVVDITTKTVFMTQATFDLDVDSIVQLKIASLDTVCVEKEFNISTKGTFLPEKKITGYYFEIGGKRMRGNSFDYSFSEVGTYPVKLGITYNSPGSKKKQLMCTVKKIVVVEPKLWAKVEERRIAQEVEKFIAPFLKLDSNAFKNIKIEDDLAMQYKKLGINGDKVVDAIKAFIDKKNATGNKPEEVSEEDKALAQKKKNPGPNDVTADSKMDTISNIKEEKGVSFKVHMGTSADKKDTTAISANGVTGIKEELIDGKYHYTFGNETKIDSIEKFYRKCLKAGIDKPIVIAYKDGTVLVDQAKNIVPATFYEDKSRIIPKTDTSAVAANNQKSKADSVGVQNENKNNLAGKEGSENNKNNLAGKEGADNSNLQKEANSTGDLAGKEGSENNKNNLAGKEGTDNTNLQKEANSTGDLAAKEGAENNKNNLQNENGKSNDLASKNNPNNKDSLNNDSNNIASKNSNSSSENKKDSLQNGSNSDVANSNGKSGNSQNSSKEGEAISNQKDNSDVASGKDNNGKNRESTEGRNGEDERGEKKDSTALAQNNAKNNENSNQNNNDLANQSDNTNSKNNSGAENSDIANSDNKNSNIDNSDFNSSNENVKESTTGNNKSKNKNTKNKNQKKAKNEYREETGDDPNGEISNASNEINEALAGDENFVPKTKIQKQILRYLKKFGEVSAKDLEFKVQVGVFRHRKRWHFPKLKGLGEIETESIEDGLTRMTIGGSYKTLREAFELNKKVIRAGQEDAFVSVYYKGKRIYIENLDKRNVFKKDEGDTVMASIDENNLIENSKSKSKKKTKEKEAEIVPENTSSPAFVEYDTRNFEPKTLIQRQTMDYIDKYGDISVEGLEFKVQVGLYKYRKSDNFPKLKQFGKIEMKQIENGITQMTIGGTFKTQREAFELNKKVIMAGQSDAFVAVYYFGKRTYMINLEKKGIFTIK